MAATRASAEGLGREADFGTLEAAKSADFLLVAGNPVADIHALPTSPACIGRAGWWLTTVCCRRTKIGPMAETSAETRSPHFTQQNTVQTYTSVHLPRVFEPWARILLEVIPVQPGQAVLDVATGPGTVARLAARLIGPAGRVTGVDISAAMLAAGRGWPVEAGAARIEYVESSATAMPLREATFDVAYCQQGLQHMSDPLGALREMRRLLKPGGRIGIAVWTQSPFGLFREIVARMGAAGGGPDPSSFGRDSAQLTAALGEAGFQDVQVQQRELVAVLDGGIPQALQVAEATSAGPLLASLSPSRQQEVRDAIASALEPHVRDGSVYLHSSANVAAAHTMGMP